MFSEQIAEYIVKVGAKPDPQSFRKMEQWLSVVEKKIQRTANRINKQDLMGGLFKIDNAKLAANLNKSLNQASNKVTFNIKNFKIDDVALNRTLQAAAMRARTITINPKVGRTGGTPQSGSSSIRGGFTDSVHRNGIRSTGVLWHSALAGGGILSGFGLRALNTTLQELQMLPVSMSSVTGSSTEAKKQLDFLNRLGNEVGATRRELAPEYTKFFASAQGTPLEQYAQSGFRSLTRYGKVMGLDQEAMKGTFKSITQMVSKQQIMAEELNFRLAA
jgi:hypothetical protein